MIAISVPGTLHAYTLDAFSIEDMERKLAIAEAEMILPVEAIRQIRERLEGFRSESEKPPKPKKA